MQVYVVWRCHIHASGVECGFDGATVDGPPNVIFISMYGVSIYSGSECGFDRAAETEVNGLERGFDRALLKEIQ